MERRRFFWGTRWTKRSYLELIQKTEKIMKSDFANRLTCYSLASAVRWNEIDLPSAGRSRPGIEFSSRSIISS